MRGAGVYVSELEGALTVKRKNKGRHSNIRKAHPPNPNCINRGQLFHQFPPQSKVIR